MTFSIEIVIKVIFNKKVRIFRKNHIIFGQGN